MSADDELHLELIDDPAPPPPDAARLQRAVARGRQRRFRRRAMFGGLAAVIALVAIGGGVAAAGRDDSSPDIQVNPPTTTVATSVANVREADESGVHYTLTLETPVATAGTEVRMSLRRENLTAHAVPRSLCDFHVVVAQVDPPPPLFVEYPCPRGDTPVAAGASFDQIVFAAAPAAPGEYSVRTEPTSANQLPEGLIRAEPFTLQVLPGGGPTPTTATSSSAPLVSTPTEPSSSVTAGTTYTEDSRTPNAGDFSGSLTASARSVTVGEGVDVELTIRNTTSRAIEPSLGSLPNGVAIVCAKDLSSDGHTGVELRSNENLFFVTSPALGPGESSGRGGTFTPTAGDVGTVTCEGVIVTTSGHWADGTITSVARLANVPPVSFSVRAATAETVTPTSSDAPTSTGAGNSGP